MHEKSMELNLKKTSIILPDSEGKVGWRNEQINESSKKQI